MIVRDGTVRLWDWQQRTSRRVHLGGMVGGVRRLGNGRIAAVAGDSASGWSLRYLSEGDTAVEVRVRGERVGDCTTLGTDRARTRVVALMGMGGPPVYRGEDEIGTEPSRV